MREAEPKSEGDLKSKERLEIAKKSGTGNRGLEHYLKMGQLDIGDFKGKVLDLGSGDIDLFNREATKAGLDVVSVDPLLVWDKRQESVKSGYEPPFLLSPSQQTDLPWPEKSVAGLAQDLHLQMKVLTQ